MVRQGGEANGSTPVRAISPSDDAEAKCNEANPIANKFSDYNAKTKEPVEHYVQRVLER